MKRIISLLSALALVLTGAAFPAFAEEYVLLDPATPTDLCAHEHIREVYYFDDLPFYVPVDDRYHTVSGRATVDTVCMDCNAVLSTRIEPNAQERHPHLFRNGRCVLCGMEGEAPLEDPVEETRPMLPLEEDPEQFVLTLTGYDLEEQADILVLRPEGREAAIALRTEDLRKEMEGTGGTLTAEIGMLDARSFRASVRLYDEKGAESVPDPEQFSLRVYAEEEGETPLAVTYTDIEGESEEEEAEWVDDPEGYWVFPWLGDGVYSF